MTKFEAKELLVILGVSFLLTLLISPIINTTQIEINKEINRVTKDNKKEVSPKRISYDSYKKWEQLLEKYNYRIEGDRIKIPDLRIAKFPNDINKIKDVGKKKRLFLSIMLIGAYHANQEIIKDREKLKRISKEYFDLDRIKKNDRKWLENKANKHGISGDTTEQVKELLYKLDIIPISLVLAQAACESGWGTSRFTIMANNIFGEWTYSEEVPGVIPKERPANASYRIRKFTTIEDSIMSYIVNLNRNFAYKKFREIRYNLRKENKTLNSIKLAEGLSKYSERREEYVQELKNIIKYNKLQQFDKLIVN